MSLNTLIFYGGWGGHSPTEMANRTAEALGREGHEVTLSDTLDCLTDAEALARYDLIVPCWTMGTPPEGGIANLTAAVRGGTGLGGFHGGMGDAFRGELDYEWMVGGHFLAHPTVGPYEVRVTEPEHPIMAGVPATFEYDSEQYYLSMDPAVTVLADTPYVYEAQTVTMPTVWTRSWGQGRVFYSAFGHQIEEFDAHPFVWDLTVRGLVWAARKGAE
jgi:hypothetical protein